MKYFSSLTSFMKCFFLSFHLISLISRVFRAAAKHLFLTQLPKLFSDSFTQKILKTQHVRFRGTSKNAHFNAFFDKNCSTKHP